MKRVFLTFLPWLRSAPFRLFHGAGKQTGRRARWESRCVESLGLPDPGPIAHWQPFWIQGSLDQVECNQLALPTLSSFFPCTEDLPLGVVHWPPGRVEAPSGKQGAVPSFWAKLAGAYAHSQQPLLPSSRTPWRPSRPREAWPLSAKKCSTHRVPYWISSYSDPVNFLLQAEPVTERCFARGCKGRGAVCKYWERRSLCCESSAPVEQELTVSLPLGMFSCKGQK